MLFFIILQQYSLIHLLLTMEKEPLRQFAFISRKSITKGWASLGCQSVWGLHICSWNCFFTYRFDEETISFLTSQRCAWFWSSGRIGERKTVKQFFFQADHLSSFDSAKARISFNLHFVHLTQAFNNRDLVSAVAAYDRRWLRELVELTPHQTVSWRVHIDEFLQRLPPTEHTDRFRPFDWHTVCPEDYYSPAPELSAMYDHRWKPGRLAIRQFKLAQKPKS